jgi:hypothetical protein
MSKKKIEKLKIQIEKHLENFANKPLDISGSPFFGGNIGARRAFITDIVLISRQSLLKELEEKVNAIEITDREDVIRGFNYCQTEVLALLKSFKDNPNAK